MATDSAVIWATNIKAAIDAVGVVAGTPITAQNVIDIWTAVKTEDKAQLGKAAVAPGGFTAPSGGGPVTGSGGPVT